MERIITASVPPGWTIRRGLDVTFIDDAEGAWRGYAYIGLGGNGRPLLRAGFHAATGPTPAPAVWDLADPGRPGRFGAWLAVMTRSPAEPEVVAK